MTQMRPVLQTMLEEIQIAANETPHVYFEPPESVKMSYPCFVYHFTDLNKVNADDGTYLVSEEYSVRYISKKPDPQIPKALMMLSRVSFDGHYVVDNLHHFRFTIRGALNKQEPELVISETVISILGGNNDSSYLG